MGFDRISEEIAHFVGLFHLEAETAKLRLDYEAFRITRDASDLEAIKGDHAPRDPDKAPKGLQIEKSVRENPTENLSLPAPKATGSSSQGTEATFTPAALVEPALPDLFTASFSGSVLKSAMIDILPNSIVTAVFQAGSLADNDLLIFDGSAEFVEQITLEDLDAIAEALSPIALWTWNPATEGISEAALQMAEQMQALTAPDIDGLTVSILRGDAADGTFVNGARVEEAPSLKDLMPAFLKPEEEDEEAPPKSDGVTDHDAGSFAVDPGHNVVSGGNRTINETVLKSVWVDAPVIAVANDVVKLDIISQVNLRVEAASLPDQTQAVSSTSLNIAQWEQTSSEAKEDGAAKDGKADNDGLPSIWNVTRIDGDLMLMNWVQQHIFTQDYDRIEIKFTGAATYIGTGENLVFNETLILNLGFHYDLIMIGGNFVTLTQITQVNVILDQDIVTGAVPAGAKLHLGDNLQVNTAAILTTGTDSRSDMKAPFKDALSDLANGAKSLSETVAQDTVFTGIHALNVLYVAGDLIQASVIEQLNYLGDSDQLHFIQDMFSTADGADVTVTSGSNAQINAATVVAIGLDSTVMAGGTAYSDALIYQAELVDTGAPPIGVQIGALANEAVAFLAEDMIEPAFKKDSGDGLDTEDDACPADVMQTMLT